MSRNSSAAGPRPPRRRGGRGLLLLLLVLPAAALVLPSTVLVVAGMIPTMVAYVIDTDAEKSAPITVGSMNLCGVLPFGIELYQRGHTLKVALDILSHPTAWLVMFGAAGIGWVIYYGVPPLVASVLVMRDEAKIRTLEDKRLALIAEWGPELAAKDEKPDPTAAAADR